MSASDNLFLEHGNKLWKTMDHWWMWGLGKSQVGLNLIKLASFEGSR